MMGLGCATEGATMTERVRAREEVSVATDQPLGVRETARRLGVHENTVRNWATSGVLHPMFRFHSGHMQFLDSDVKSLLERSRGLGPSRATSRGEGINS
jgi:Helix-turn-helix domain